MALIEINPRQTFAELKIMQERERSRLIAAALEGHELTKVQRRQLEIERKISKKSHKSLACVAELRYKYNNYF